MVTLWHEEDNKFLHNSKFGRKIENEGGENIWINPDIINSDIINPDIINSDIINSDIINPDIINSDIINSVKQKEKLSF